MAKTNHFRQIQSFKPDYAAVEIKQYESTRSGMRVVIVHKDGPKVEGTFILATEIHDDSGAPHTLEHLCFMGSRNYQYKGVLDKLASRAYSYTNASTATDYTNYTLCTAGWEGFSQILPVYLEHVLFPVLTDSAFYTEVHHIDENGHNAGVVYSEMQSVENTQEERINECERHCIYPEGNGYRYETGGMTGPLRVLTNERIRQFHKEMYQPSNLCLLLVGDVNETQLLTILNNFESDFMAELSPTKTTHRRPWVESGSNVSLNESVLEKIEFPEDDESVGAISITYLGPPCTDLLQSTALRIVTDYLTESSVSVLEKNIVEEEHLASATNAFLEERTQSLICFSVDNVASEELELVEKRCTEIIENISREPLDMDYLRECVRARKRKVRYVRGRKSSAYELLVTADHLYGDRNGSNLRESLGNLQIFDILEAWDEKMWQDLIKKWLTDAHHVSVLGSPSAKVAEEMKKAEEARVEEQKANIGDKGLKELAEKLAEAKMENEREIPRDIIEKFHVPGVESIKLIDTITARSGAAKHVGKLDNRIQKTVDRDGDIPELFIQFEHTKMNFVTISIVFSTIDIPVELKPLLAVFMNNFFDTPIRRNGERIEYEQVVRELKDETILYRILTGAYDGNGELMTIYIVTEPEKYQEVIEKLNELLFSSILDIERLISAVKKLLAEIPEQLRNGYEMTNAIDELIHYEPASTNRANNVLVHKVYLKHIDNLLRTVPETRTEPKTVIENLEKLRKSICRYSNMRIGVVGDIEALSNPVTAWKTLIKGNTGDNGQFVALGSRRAVLSDIGRNPGGRAYIVPIGATESSYALFTAKGIESREDSRYPALLVALEYLQIVEGAIWVALRGQGVSYGFEFAHNVDRGCVQCVLDTSPDVAKAYLAAREAVADIVSGKTAFETHDLEGAISGYVLSFVDRQSHEAEAGAESFVAQVLRKDSKEYGMNLLKRVRQVSIEQVKEVLRDVIMPVFDPKKADLTVICAKVLEEDISRGFKEAGFTPEVRALASFKDSYGIGSDDTDDEEEETSESEEES